MERIKRSWELVKASFEVLKQDRELILFPIVSGVIMFFVTLTFLIPTLVGNFFDNLFVNGIPIFGYIVLFLFYLVQYIVVYYNSTALVGAAMIRLRGGDPTVKDGYRIAWSQILPIIGWALLSATVGLILNMLSSNSKNKGRGKSLIASLIGAAWNVLTFLVVPVLAVEGLGPIQAVKRSWELLKGTWGEQISGKLSIGLVFGLIGFGGGAVLVGLAVGLSILLESFIPAIIFGILLFLFITALSLLNSTLSSIFSAAVYEYAVEGKSGFFDAKLIEESIYS